ncbi:MAG: FHA domain-containing protein [Bacteriovoracaceae bacterium]|jgi:pSer/pThr/pTyr-binding forkhead associated (FHA) protein|nr:FHA domain-containing protein [Bacteriovoracaceae bacterium]
MSSVKSKTAFFLEGIDSKIEMNQKQLLVGSSDKCDIYLNHPSISFYHCYLSINDECIQVIDLNSSNGILVNNTKINGTSILSEGDEIQIGEYIYYVGATDSTDSIEDKDANVLAVETQNVKQFNLDNKDLILIDDEYCELRFEQNISYEKKQGISTFTFNLDDTGFVEYGNLINPIEIEDQDIQKNYLIITTYINGIAVSEKTFNEGIKRIYAANKESKNSIFFPEIKDKKFLFLSIENGVINLKDDLNLVCDTSKMDLVDGNTYHILGLNYSIEIKVVSKDTKIVNIPFLTRSKEILKQDSKVFAILFLPFLLLLFVKISTPPKKETKVAIIYKKPTKSKVDKKKIASENTTSKKQNTGHQKQTKKPEKIAFKKSGSKKKSVKKKAKLVAKSAPSKKVKAIKTYKFKFNRNKLFKNRGKSIKVAKSKAVSTSVSRGIASVSNTNISSNATSVGNFGANLKGAMNDFGAKGLSSSKGRNSSYIQSRTVVLGSMDPDLLRKILRRYLPQFRHCYQQELNLNDENIKGVVDLNFKIGPRGSANSVKIAAKDKRFSKRGIKCMKRVLSIIDFPSPKGGGTVAVRQPLNFFSDKNS